MDFSIIKLRIESEEDTVKFLNHAYSLDYSWPNGSQIISEHKRNLRLFVVDRVSRNLGYFTKEEAYKDAASLKEISLEEFLNIEKK
jgi:hypothetical protein